MFNTALIPLLHERDLAGLFYERMINNFKSDIELNKWND